MARKKSNSNSGKKSASSRKTSSKKSVQSTVTKELKKGIKKTAKKKPLIAVGLILVLVLISSGFAYLELSGTTHIFNPQNAGASSSANTSGSEVSEIKFDGVVYDDLQIHFMELGNWYTGDSVYIKAGDTDILIDAGSKKNSAARTEAYIDQFCTDGKLEYVIATHAHEDHIAGFSGTNKNGIFYHYNVGTIIDFPKTDSTSNIYNDYVTARTYAIDNGAKHYTALEAYNDTSLRKIKINDDITMEILYQKFYEEKASTENNYSVCTLFTYKDQHYLFTGDLEEVGESSLVDSNTIPTCELYKAGHHGSKTSSSEKFMQVVQPKVVAVCCCAGSSEYTDNEENKFPTQQFINNVAPYTSNIYVTSLSESDENKTAVSMNGDINFSAENEKYSVACSNNNTILKETDWFKAHRTWPL